MSLLDKEGDEKKIDKPGDEGKTPLQLLKERTLAMAEEKQAAADAPAMRNMMQEICKKEELEGNKLRREQNEVLAQIEEQKKKLQELELAAKEQEKELERKKEQQRQQMEELEKMEAEAKKAADEAAKTQTEETGKKGDSGEKEGEEGEKKDQEAKVEMAETEVDAPEDTRTRLMCNLLEINQYDSTLNATVSEGRILHHLHVDGFNNLFAGARANVGVIGGRYYFECKILSYTSKSLVEEVRIGYSGLQSHLCLADGKAVAFSSTGHYMTGDLKVDYKAKFRRLDIVGVLLNLDKESPNCNTVSLFIDGRRATLPVKLPDSLCDQPIFPHISYKNCTIAMNFNYQWHPLPFTVRMIGDASVDDVQGSPFRSPYEYDEGQGQCEIIFVIGFDNKEWLRDFTERSQGRYQEVSRGYMKTWLEKSGASARQQFLEDNGKSISRLMSLRQRNYLYTYSPTLLKKDRMALTKRFAGYKISCVVNISAASRPEIIHASFADASLPTDDEGFMSISFTTSEEEAAGVMEDWKEKCRLQTKVEVEVGSWYKLRSESWKLLKEEKKEGAKIEKPVDDDFLDEGGMRRFNVARFSDEDWALAELRFDMHHILFAFHEDCKDSVRESFPPSLFPHYYKVYHGRSFDMRLFNCKTMEEVCAYVPDVVKIENGILIPILPKDITLEHILQLVDDARQTRVDAVAGGDESAELKFSVKNRKRGRSRSVSSHSSSASSSRSTSNKRNKPITEPTPADIERRERGRRERAERRREREREEQMARRRRFPLRNERFGGRGDFLNKGSPSAFGQPSQRTNFPQRGGLGVGMGVNMGGGINQMPFQQHQGMPPNLRPMQPRTGQFQQMPQQQNQRFPSMQNNMMHQQNRMHQQNTMQQQPSMMQQSNIVNRTRMSGFHQQVPMREMTPMEKAAEQASHIAHSHQPPKGNASTVNVPRLNMGGGNMQVAGGHMGMGGGGNMRNQQHQSRFNQGPSHNSRFGVGPQGSAMGGDRMGGRSNTSRAGPYGQQAPHSTKSNPYNDIGTAPYDPMRAPAGPAAYDPSSSETAHRRR